MYICKIIQHEYFVQGKPDVPEVITPEPPLDLPKLAKNDAVNRFWLSVEPYCCDISNEDIKVLEDLLLEHEDDSDFYKVPPLGKHYAEKWAEEDLLDEQRDG